jgi:uncharacterized paraquat-inducible protein A
MQIENNFGLSEWLLGSTVLCHSCGCLWLIPSAQSLDSYRCRQCGTEIKAKHDPEKQSHKERSAGGLDPLTPNIK